MYHVLIPPHDLAHFEVIAPLITPDDSERVIGDINGYTFSFIHRQLRQNPQTRFPEDCCGEVTVDTDQTATILARPHNIEEESVSILTEGGSALLDPECSHVQEHIEWELQTIAQFAGKQVELYVSDTPRKMVPPRGTTRTFVVVLGSAPPGYFDMRRTSRLFDESISEPGTRALLHSPTVDVGRIVTNHLDEPVAQIVGHTCYLYLPLNPYGLKKLVDPSTRLLRKTLTLAWNEYQGGDINSNTPLTTVETSEQYAKLAMDPERDIARLHTKLEDIDDRLEAAQEMLTRAIADRRTLVAAIAGARQHIAHDPVAAWRSLVDCPYLDRIEQASHGLLYYISTPITVEDEEGTERYIGPLCLYIEPPQTIRAWSLENPHPSGIPHPHVDSYGTACLGNVTQTICQLLAEAKEADAVVLILRMFAEGYDPDLTEHSLRGWPTPKEYQRRKQREQIAPNTHAPTKRDPSGDDSGHWFNRLIHNSRAGYSRSD